MFEEAAGLFNDGGDPLPGQGGILAQAHRPAVAESQSVPTRSSAWAAVRASCAGAAKRPSCRPAASVCGSGFAPGGGIRPIGPRGVRPALSPAQLAKVSVLQFLLSLSERDAAEAVRCRIEFKYALGFDLDDPRNPRPATGHRDGHRRCTSGCWPAPSVPLTPGPRHPEGEGPTSRSPQESRGHHTRETGAPPCSPANTKVRHGVKPNQPATT
ncbi:transposase [Streptomyces sp. NPDC056437]|uniref:transposase n=1 Tax=Streptomyces sp. NPDC056437 TaxID=3345816 RepID=UPI0036B8EA23